MSQKLCAPNNLTFPFWALGNDTTPPPGNCHVTSWRVQARVTTLGGDMLAGTRPGDSFPRVDKKFSHGAELPTF